MMCLTIKLEDLPEKPLSLEPILSVMRRRLRGEKDVSIRRALKERMKRITG